MHIRGKIHVFVIKSLILCVINLRIRLSRKAPNMDQSLEMLKTEMANQPYIKVFTQEEKNHSFSSSHWTIGKDNESSVPSCITQLWAKHTTGCLFSQENHSYTPSSFPSVACHSGILQRWRQKPTEHTWEICWHVDCLVTCYPIGWLGKFSNLQEANLDLFARVSSERKETRGSSHCKQVEVEYHGKVILVPPQNRLGREVAKVLTLRVLRYWIHVC